MAFSTKEQAIIDAGKANGKSIEEVKQALARYRATAEPEMPTQTTAQTTPAVAEGDSLSVSDVLGAVFGGGKIGEAIGTKVAEMRATPEEKAAVAEFGSDTFEGPSAGQLVGDVIRTGANFIPVGKLASGATQVAKFAGAGKAAQTVGNVVAGGVTGAAADIGASMSEGQRPELGLGTLLGVGIPAATPVGRALVNVLGRGGRKVAFEVSGALTGTSEETLEQAFQAARKGGKEIDTLTDAMRGNVTPEKLVNKLRDAISQVATQRSQIYKETLAELGNQVVPTAPARQQFVNSLAETGITVDENGVLNFANSKLRTVPNAQTKLQQAYNEIAQMPDQLSLEAIDTTRQAVKAIKSIAGDEPSANLANMLIDEAVRSVRTAGEQVDGYAQMLDNFGETSEFLDELQRGLMSSDKATVDQTFRRMATALRTNNEQRMALVKELDEVTGDATLSGIAGQQLSEMLPRGIFGRFFAPFAIGGAVSGLSPAVVIPSLVMSSPRVSGEFVRALGMSAAKTDALLDTVSAARDLFIKAGALGGTAVDQLNDAGEDAEQDRAD